MTIIRPDVAVIQAAKQLVRDKVRWKGMPRLCRWTNAEIALYRAVQLLEAEETNEKESHNGSV